MTIYIEGAAPLTATSVQPTYTERRVQVSNHDPTEVVVNATVEYRISLGDGRDMILSGGVWRFTVDVDLTRCHFTPRGGIEDAYERGVGIRFERSAPQRR